LRWNTARSLDLITDCRAGERDDCFEALLRVLNVMLKILNKPIIMYFGDLRTINYSEKCKPVHFLKEGVFTFRFFIS
jgi:hypothetical protein